MDNLTDTQELKFIQYDAIKKQALDYIKKIGEKKWDDYTEHDPGITILENLLFAIMDLDYRLKFQIEDILAIKDNTQDNKIEFFNAEKILPSSPITLNDYYKIILDTKGVINCKIIPRNNDNEIRGLYDVYLYIDNIIINKDKVIDNVKKLLYQNRNLCEDFNSITLFENIDVTIDATIHISNMLNIDDQYIDIFSSVLIAAQCFFIPIVKYKNLSNILSIVKTFDKIYNGPLLTHGFILDSDLEKSKIKNEFLILDLIEHISKITNIDHISNFKIINAKTNEEYKFKIRTEINQVIHLVFKKSNIKIIKRQKNIDIDHARALSCTKRLYAILAQKNDNNTESIGLYQGKYKNLSKYYSIQRDFPLIYGVGEEGTYGKNDEIQTKNLKCYLLIFDQICSIFLSKLENFKNIISINTPRKQFEKYKIPEDVPYINVLLKPPTNHSKCSFSEDMFFAIQREELGFKFSDFRSKNIIEVCEQYLNDILYKSNKNMRNYMIDHLLNRFSENFNNDIDIQADKKKILMLYDDLSYNRAKGLKLYDTAEQQDWGSDNMSYFEKKIYLFWNIKNIKLRLLYMQLKSKIAIVKKTIGEEDLMYDSNLYMNSIYKNQYKFFYRSNCKNILELILLHGEEESNYKIVKKTKKTDHNINTTNYEIQLFYNHNDTDYISLESIYGRIQNYDTAKNIIQKSIENIKRINIESEGMHLLEHIFLRDKDNKIYVHDNISFQATIIFPSWPKKFQDSTLRKNIEQWIYDNAPAHINFNILWLGVEQMELFENTYKYWYNLKTTDNIKNEDMEIIKKKLLNYIEGIK